MSLIANMQELSRVLSAAETILGEPCRALEIDLSRDEVEHLSAAFPPDVTAGTRYPEKQLKALGV